MLWFEPTRRATWRREGPQRPPSPKSRDRQTRPIHPSMNERDFLRGSASGGRQVAPQVVGPVGSGPLLAHHQEGVGQRLFTLALVSVHAPLPYLVVWGTVSYLTPAGCRPERYFLADQNDMFPCRPERCFRADLNFCLLISCLIYKAGAVLSNCDHLLLECPRQGM